MNQNLNRSHINDRFQERFGRKFSQRDKREILNIIKDKKHISCIDRDNAFLFFIKYENNYLNVVIDKNTCKFVTAYIPYKIKKRIEGEFHGK